MTWAKITQLFVLELLQYALTLYVQAIAQAKACVITAKKYHSVFAIIHLTPAPAAGGKDIGAQAILTALAFILTALSLILLWCQLEYLTLLTGIHSSCLINPDGLFNCILKSSHTTSPAINDDDPHASKPLLSKPKIPNNKSIGQ